MNPYSRGYHFFQKSKRKAKIHMSLRFLYNCSSQYRPQVRMKVKNNITLIYKSVFLCFLDSASVSHCLCLTQSQSDWISVSICLSVCLSVCLSLSLSLFLSLYLTLSIYNYLYTNLPNYLYVYLPT